MKRETTILSEIKSEHVVGFDGLYRSFNNIYIFMHFCNGGDLLDLVKLRGSLTEEEARHFLMMIVKGFEDINE